MHPMRNILVCLCVFCWMATSIVAETDLLTCEEGFLPCNDSAGNCIHWSKSCDGFHDCLNGNDELPHCRPKNTLFSDIQQQNGSKQCISAHRTAKGFSAVDNITGRGDTNFCASALPPSSCQCDQQTQSLTCQWPDFAQPWPDLVNVHPNLTKIVFTRNSEEMNEDCLEPDSSRVGLYSHLPSLLHLSYTNTGLTCVQPYSFSGYQLTHLGLSRNELTELQTGTFVGLHVCHLDLSYNHVLDFPAGIFGRPPPSWIDLSHNSLTLEVDDMFSNLKGTKSVNGINMLELHDNLIQEIHATTFAGLQWLHRLDLSHNPISFIEEGSFDDLIRVTTLQLDNNDLTELPDDLFRNTIHLQHLHLSDSAKLTRLPPAIFHDFIECETLNLSNVIIDNIAEVNFSSLPKKCNVQFAKLMYCFYIPTIHNCTPKSDGISSFDHLLVSPPLVLLAWTCAIFTLLCNLAIFGTRWYLDRNLAHGVHDLVLRDAKVMSLFIKHLSFSDMLTGVYLIGICTVNEKFKGQYYRHALEWIHSVHCKVLGVIAMSSAEISMMILTFIALDRFMTIAYDLGKPKLSIQTIRIVLVVIWLVLAVVPALLWSGRLHNYYGNNGVCLPLYLQEPRLKGWIYSLAVVIGLNGVLIVVIILSYGGIFYSITKWRQSSVLVEEKEERELLWRFFLLVFLNLCCWLPTFVFKILAVSQYVLPNESYAWIVTFVFPLNSAMNPIVYSLSSSEFRSRVMHVTGCHRVYSLFIRRLHVFGRRLSAPFTSSVSDTCNGGDLMKAASAVDGRVMPEVSPSLSFCRKLKEKCRTSLPNNQKQLTCQTAPPVPQQRFRRNESLGLVMNGCELVPLRSERIRNSSF